MFSLLAAHSPYDPKEASDLERMRDFAARLTEPFSRSSWPAHFTGSALIIDPPGERVVLVLHAALGRWLQPGGHAEPVDNADLRATALREAREETGLEVELVSDTPLDVDVHTIPARKSEPEHEHLDVRFLFRARDPGALRHDPGESRGAQWVSWAEALQRADEPSLRRMLNKARSSARALSITR